MPAVQVHDSSSRRRVKCEKCGSRTKLDRIAETKKLKYRRRVCKCGHQFVTKEQIVKGPFKWPKKPKKEPPPKPSQKPKAEPFGPAMEQWNIPVTRDSPEWLKKIALSLG